DKLISVAPYVQKLNTDACSKFSHIENELIKWFTKARGQFKTVTRFMIQIKARLLAKKTSYQSEYPNHKLSNRRKITIAQFFPEDYAEKQSEFLSYVIYLKKENQYPLSLIRNMDETPMLFNLPSNTTVEQSGSKTVSILSTGHERSNFTIVLVYLADRTKLPPVIIFKLKKILCKEFPEGVVISANSQEWMNEKEIIW
ncbi:9173_t:CDS:2, partial [Funneliformis geosporum]